MEDFFVQECCVQGTDLENHGPTSILCDDPLPIESTGQLLLVVLPSPEAMLRTCLLASSLPGLLGPTSPR